MAGKARVHELAKELEVTSKELLETLNELGEFVKSASSTVEPPVARRVRKFYADKAAKEAPKKEKEASSAKTKSTAKTSKPAAKKASSEKKPSSPKKTAAKASKPSPKTAAEKAEKKSAPTPTLQQRKLLTKRLPSRGPSRVRRVRVKIGC